MKSSQLKRELKARINAGIERPILIEGSPGIGKTELVGQLAAELGIEFRCVHAPLMQPEDYGFPVVSQDKTTVEFIVSKSKFPVVGSGAAERGILLFDEFNQCEIGQQKTVGNILLAREIHGQKIMPGWTIVATGNRQKDRAGANKLLTQVRDRCTTVELEVSLDDWTQWALNAGVKSEVVAFLRFRPDLLNRFDANAERNATPRGWVKEISASLGVVSPEAELEIFSGAVGEGPAAEFHNFLKIMRNLPSPDAVLLNPTTAPLPENDPATLFALVVALAQRATVANFNNAVAYVNRMAPEFVALFMKDVIRRKPELQSTKVFINWASGDGAKLLS